MTAFRKGDIATIDVIVTSSFNETQVCVKPVDGYQDVYLKPHELTMLRPKFDVGDHVTWSTHDGADSWIGHILSIANDHLWVQLDDGSFSTVWASKASRVDPEEKHDPDFDEIETSEAAAAETRRLENEEMDKHFERHPHG